MKVLIVHTKYKQKGGEDIVVSEETSLLHSKGITVRNLNFSNDGGTLLKFLQLPFNVGSYLKTKKVLKQFRPDVVHIHNLHFAASTSVLYAIKQSGVPVVFTVHNYRLLCPSATLFHNQQPFIQSLRGGFPWAAVKYGVYNESKFLTFWLGFSMWLNNKLGSWKIIDKFIVLTDQSKEILQESFLKLNTGRIVVKPNFVSENTAEVETRGDHYLYVGRLSEEKGIDLLLNAFKHSAHKLVIIGDGPLKEKVVAFCKANANVTYRGLQDKRTIESEMRKATALVFSSIWHETFGLTIIEAFAAGTPVIASNIGAAARLVTNEVNGLHFQPSDVNDLKQKLALWQQLPETVKESYRLKAKNSFEQNFTGDKNFSQLISIYNEVVEIKKTA